jgi:hypothetical protein
MENGAAGILTFDRNLVRRILHSGRDRRPERAHQLPVQKRGELIRA